MPTPDECVHFAIQNAVMEEKIKTIAKTQENFVKEFQELREEIRQGIHAEVRKTITVELSKEVKMGLIAVVLYLLLGDKSLPLLSKLFNL